jgi:hypothetical protein
MAAPPLVYVRARDELASRLHAVGLVRVCEEFHEEAFGSAFAEFRGERGALRLVWDGKDGVLVAYVLRGGRWIDVECLGPGKPPPIDRDRGDARIARVLAAALEALER